MQCPYYKKNMEKVVIQLQVQGQKLRPSIILDGAARPLFEENRIASTTKNTILTDGVSLSKKPFLSFRGAKRRGNP